MQEFRSLSELFLFGFKLEGGALGGEHLRRLAGVAATIGVEITWYSKIGAPDGRVRIVSVRPGTCGHCAQGGTACSIYEAPGWLGL